MKKRSITLLFSMAFLFTSCASVTKSGLDSHTVDNYYASTGVEKYFLADIPSWASFNQSAGCYHQSTVRYFDINGLMKSYGLTYNNSLQVQAAFNEDFALLKKVNELRPVTIKDEEFIFYKVTEKISSKIVFFSAPEFSQVNLIWLDEVLGNKLNLNKLKSFLNSSAMEKGVPVLLSFCLTKAEVEAQFPELNVKMITAELFSVYDFEGNKSPGFKIDLNHFFKADQKLYLYSQKKLVPFDDVKGTYKLLNY